MTSKSQTTATKKSEQAGAVRAGAPRAAQTPLSGFRDEIDRVFERFLGPAFEASRGLAPRGGWDPFGFLGGRGTLDLSPLADISESDAGFELSVELPGMKEEDIELTVGDDLVTVKGEKREETETEEKDYHLTERRFGSFKRTFTLPPGVDPAKVGATFADGVLKVSMPKTEAAKAKPRRISVGRG